MSALTMAGVLPGRLLSRGEERPVGEGEAAVEERLVRLARGGDADAFAALVERYQDRLWGFLASWVPDPDDRQELAQEVFIAAYRGIRGFRGDARFSTWLFQIAVNKARGHRRTQARAPRRVALEDAPEPEMRGGLPTGSPPAAPDRSAARARLRTRLWRLVEELRPDWQAALRLRYVEGMTHPEIAATLDRPVGTVKTHLHRARKALAARIEEEGLT